LRLDAAIVSRVLLDLDPARIARLHRALRADLDDPETRLGLELAVRALRVVG
jgi:hypothetical protein